MEAIRYSVSKSNGLKILSVYMQCKGIIDNSTDFMKVVNQLTDT